MIEAIRGSGYTGDIAVDDFDFKDKTCFTIPINAKPGMYDCLIYTV